MRVDGDVDMNALPGADLVLEGIADVEHGRDTIAAALTRMASPSSPGRWNRGATARRRFSSRAPALRVACRDRSDNGAQPLFQEGRLLVRHFDPHSQALSNIERGFAQDLEDVASMVRSGLVDPERAQQLFGEIEPDLFRCPAIDAAAFRAKVVRALGTAG